MRLLLSLLSLTLFLPVSRIEAATDPTDIDITKKGAVVDKNLIPVAIEGFTGETDSVIKSDLWIQGFEFVSQDKAMFLIKGQNSGRLEGRLIDLSKNKQILGKAYNGASARKLAHAFTDEIVKTITGTNGIAQTKICFKVSTGRTSELYISDFDGHNPVKVTRDNSIVAAPTWIPGQFSLIYTSYMKENPDIFSHELSTGVRKTVAAYAGLKTSAAVSPDGARVAMILSKGGSPDVYVADIDGGNIKRLTTTRETESSPCWSADGLSILFTSRVSGRAQLYTIPALGGKMRRIGTIGASSTVTEPDWSPDGSTIIFTSQYRSGFQLCTVPASGGQVTTVAEGEDPSWAPNSRTVVYTRRVNGSRVVSLLDVPSKRTKDIRPVQGSCSQPSWSR